MIEVKLSAVDVSNLIATIAEGGSNSWAQCRAFVRDGDGEYVSCEIRDGGFESERVNESWHKLDKDSISAGVAKLLTGEMGINEEIVKQFSGEVDDWDYDADGADCVAQIICFNEVVYG